MLAKERDICERLPDGATARPAPVVSEASNQADVYNKTYKSGDLFMDFGE